MNGSSAREKLIAYLDRMSEDQLTRLLPACEEVLYLDKRKHSRKRYDLKVVYAFENEFHTDDLKDLSISGLFIKTDAKLNPGDELYLSLMLPEKFEPLKLKGVVRRVAKDGVGIEFNTSPYHRDKVLHHLQGV